MAYGLDIGRDLSLLCGLSRKGDTFVLKRALVLPGLFIDPDEKPDHTRSTGFANTYGSLSGIGLKPGGVTASIPGADVMWRFAPTGGDPKAVQSQVRLEAEEMGGGDFNVLGDHIIGTATDYSPVAHIALAREEVVDHYGNSLSQAGVDVARMSPACAALYNAYRVSGEQDWDGVYLYANIGDDTTDIILVRETSLLYARSLKSGVNTIVDRILPEYGGDRASVRQKLFAEFDLRPSIADENISGSRGVSAGQEAASGLFQQILASVTLAKGSHADPKLEAGRIVISGAGAAIPGLKELMMHRTRKTVTVFDPLKKISVDNADQQTQQAITSFRPALAVAVGLAIMATRPDANALFFVPQSVRRRREFMQKNLFLYLAAALVLLILIPAYFMTSTAAQTAEEELKSTQRAPIGRYVNVSQQIATRKAAKERTQKRADAPLMAGGPGRAATQVLMAFAKQRPDAVHLVKADLESASIAKSKTPGSQFRRNPRGGGRESVKNPEDAKTKLRLTFFIEQLNRDPTQIKGDVRAILKSKSMAALGVKAVTEKSATNSKDAKGLDVVMEVELDTKAGAQ